MYLITKTEVYRVPDERTVKELIKQAKNSNEYSLIKYDCTYKERKQKGEVIDSWYRVTLIKKYDDEKEPIGFPISLNTEEEEEEENAEEF